jgi:hypothetical protein
MFSLRPVSVSVYAMAMLLIAGCEKFTEPPKPSSAAITSNTANESVALPAKALPPSDSSISVAPSTSSTAAGDKATTSSQANPKELSKQQETAAMPMPGQVNNHSTPEPLDKKQ